MKLIRILYFFDNDMFEIDMRKYKDIWKNISKYLNDMKEGEDILFD